MTFNTKRNIVRNIPEIFATYIRPLKIAFKFFRDFIKSTIFTMFGFPQPYNNPVMFSSVTSLISFPKIIFSRTISQTPTLLRTIFARSKFKLANSKPKRFATNLANMGSSFSSSQKTTLFRTINFASFKPAFIGLKRFFTIRTVNFYHVDMIGQYIENFKFAQMLEVQGEYYNF